MQRCRSWVTIVPDGGLPRARGAAASRPGRVRGRRLRLPGGIIGALPTGGPMATLVPQHRVAAGALEIAYHESGPRHGPVAVLLHGFPYSIQAYAEVVP